MHTFVPRGGVIIGMDAVEHWYVTLTLAGEAWDEADVHAALGRLLEEHPFLESCTYAADTVEVRYWEQAETLHDALAMGLRLWGEYRRSAGLPPWQVTGCEVVDRRTFHRRTVPVAPRAVVGAVGELRRLCDEGTPAWKRPARLAQRPDRERERTR